jgi:CIC family chloride channel protein
MIQKKARKRDLILEHRLLRKYFPLVHEDLAAVYSRDLQKWLLIAPVIGVVTGLLITGIVIVILKEVWPRVLAYFLGHHWAILPGLVLGFVATGLIMQYLTPNPDEHSTEEVICSYHEHQGDIDMRPFFAKLLAAVTTVGFGGSAALEGPSIYGGASIGSWIWTKVRRMGFDSRDRRIMLICGAAAGMSAVFRAPLTGIVFALEMPYRDDLAHEALVPSLIASVVAFITMGAFLGTSPLFNFATSFTYTRHDLYWSALLGLLIGLAATIFVVTFRRVRRLFVAWTAPHWMKMGLGGLLTAICGLIFLWMYPGNLIPIGPNYEAVDYILKNHYGSGQLVAFSVLKLGATISTLGFGGVSAMFVPLFLTGGALGTAFAQSIVHTPALGLYAAVGMASFISAGYKTPLAAVVFVAEATGGHAFIIPALIGAAVAYAVSGDASASGDQRLHEGVKVQELRYIPVRAIMQEQMVSADAAMTVQEFLDAQTGSVSQEAFPVLEGEQVLGAVSMVRLIQVPSDEWKSTRLGDVLDESIHEIAPDCDVMEALRLLLSERQPAVLLVRNEDESIAGIVTRTDILRALKNSERLEEDAHAPSYGVS